MKCLFPIGQVTMLLLCTTLCSQAPPSTGQLSGQMSGVLSSMTALPDQFAMSFGYCPSDYTYSMEVWNDLPTALIARLQSVVAVQGVHFNSTTAASQTIAPYSSSGSSPFNDIHVCHALIHLATRWQHSMIAPNILTRPVDINPKDKHTYFYHAFTLQGQPQGEFMGPGWYGGPYTSSTAFDGIFFNNSPVEAFLQFTQTAGSTDQIHKVTLAPHSFSLLSSDTAQRRTLRSSKPRSFSFITPKNTISVPLPPLGLAQSYFDAVSTSTVTIPLTYTYELYQDKQGKFRVGVQGFNMGNHNQIGITNIPGPTSLAPLRDISPLDCSIWLQSPEHYQKEMKTPNPSLLPYVLPTEQIWATYATKDYTLQQRLREGKATTFSIIRPQAQEKEGILYVFSLGTTHEARARRFLTEIVKNKDLIKNLTQVPATATIAQAIATALHAPPVARITEPVSGVSGLLLLTDTFIPYGGGQEAARAYTIPPSLLRADESFASIITAQLDPQQFANKQQAVAEFREHILSWLSTFQTQQSTATKAAPPPGSITLSTLERYRSYLESLVPELVIYLKQKGSPTLFTNPTSPALERSFSAKGYELLYFIFFGPVSFTSPPLLRSAGSNVSLTGHKPASWPKS
jgi:hypothetical protein